MLNLNKFVIGLISLIITYSVLYFWAYHRGYKTAELVYTAKVTKSALSSQKLLNLNNNENLQMAYYLSQAKESSDHMTRMLMNEKNKYINDFNKCHASLRWVQLANISKRRSTSVSYSSSASLPIRISTGSNNLLSNLTESDILTTNILNDQLFRDCQLKVNAWINLYRGWQRNSNLLGEDK